MANAATLTQHGAKRTARRLGCGLKGAARAAEIARLRGTPHDATTGKLRRYLDRRQLASPDGLFIVHGAHLYVFSRTHGRLITMFALPRALRLTRKA